MISGSDVLDHRAVAARDDEMKRAARTLALREADQLGRRDGGVALADDLQPSA